MEEPSPFPSTHNHKNGAHSSPPSTGSRGKKRAGSQSVFYTVKKPSHAKSQNRHKTLLGFVFTDTVVTKPPLSPKREDLLGWQIFWYLQEGLFVRFFKSSNYYCQISHHISSIFLLSPIVAGTETCLKYGIHERINKRSGNA